MLIVFVVRGEYARKESVAGFLEPVRGVIRIYPSRGGVISDMLVHDGQTVARDDLLFKVAVPQTMADGGDADSALLTNFARERIALSDALEREHASRRVGTTLTRGARHCSQELGTHRVAGPQLQQRRLPIRNSMRCADFMNAAHFQRCNG